VVRGRERCHGTAGPWNISHSAPVSNIKVSSILAVPDVARCVLCEAAGVHVPAKGLPLLASVVGVGAPMVALSGLVPLVASPVLLALGVIAALALARGESRSGR
jgi:hypothetical protein